MIIATLKDLGRYEPLNPNFKKAFGWLESTDLKSLEEGRVAIDGDAVYASVQKYSTYDPEERVFEAHKKYVDIQLLVSGHERIYYAPTKKLMPSEPYAEENDFQALSGIPTQTVNLFPGIACVLFPEDGHMPCLWSSGAPEPVVKIVVKVRV